MGPGNWYTMYRYDRGLSREEQLAHDIAMAELVAMFQRSVRRFAGWPRGGVRWLQERRRNSGHMPARAVVD